MMESRKLSIGLIALLLTTGILGHPTVAVRAAEEAQIPTVAEANDAAEIEEAEQASVEGTEEDPTARIDGGDAAEATAEEADSADTQREENPEAAQSEEQSVPAVEETTPQTEAAEETGETDEATEEATEEPVLQVQAEKKGWQTENGKKYYYQNNKAVTGQRKIDGYWYMFDPAKGGAMVIGWYDHTNQTNPKGGPKRCYYDAQGHMLYGQKKIDGYWYMFHPSSGAMIKGWYNHTNETNPKGGPKRCYYDAQGHMLYGQKKIDGYWYMFHPSSGAMIKGFYNHTNATNPKGGPKTCYYDGQGHMLYGQRKIDGYWYMFHPSSGAMIKGWYNHTNETNPKGGPKKVYYDAKGHMLYGKQTIDGKEYYFHTSSGALDEARTNYPQACAVLDSIGWDLRKAFNWSASRTYQTQSTNLTSRQYADYTFKNNKGNCYGMAAVFYEMAKAMGYEAHQMSGSVPLARGGMGPHSWVEIVVNGRTYVCDPDFQHESGKNGYMINYGQSGTWRYSNYKRMN